jgi:hypothetical protein
VENYGVVALQIDFDRIPLFTRAKVSMYPIVAIIISLLPSKKFKWKYIFLIDLWTGTGKLRTQLFLQPFLQSLHTLGQKVHFKTVLIFQ